MFIQFASTPLLAQSQSIDRVPLIISDGPPDHSVSEYYFDSTAGQLYFTGYERNTPINGLVQNLKECHEWIFLRLDGKLHCIRPGSNAPIQISDYFCGDSILGFWEYAKGSNDSLAQFSFWHRSGQAIVSGASGPFVKMLNPKPEALNGEIAFCLPYIPFHAYKERKLDRPCLWGMMSEKGKWLIPPIYLLPFHFQNGRAKVSEFGHRIIIE